MINLMIGAPGGGKSYEACVYHILPALKRGRKVITNLPVNLEMFAALDAGYVDLLEFRRMPQPVRGVWGAGTDGPAFKIEGDPTPQPLTTRLFSTVWDYWTDWRHPSGMGPLFVIDECQLSLPKGGIDKHVSEWYSLHRHYNCDVLLLTQAYGRLDPTIRDLVQLLYRVKKAVAFGFAGRYIRKVQDGIRGEVVSTSTRTYEKKYFNLYKSHTQGQSVAEEGASDTRPIWMAWPIVGAAICLGVSVVYALSGGFSGLVTPKVPTPQKLASNKPDSLPPGGLTPARRSDIATVSTLPAGVPAAPSLLPVPAPSELAPLEPYAALGVHLTGSLVKADGSTVYTFLLSRQGSALYGITNADLVTAGYKFRALGHCLGELSFGTVRRVVVCDTPQVSMALGPAAGSGVRTVSASPSEGVKQAREGAPLAGSGTGARSAP